MKRNKLYIIFVAIALLFIGLIIVCGNTGKVKADGNYVYVKDTVVEANESGLVYVELAGEGKANDNVELFIHTEGGTAIPGLDYVNINTLIKVQFDKSGVLSYKVSIKTLNTSESREKIRTYNQSGAVYGRYFKLVLEKANGASVDINRNSAKCYLPYDYKVEVVTGVRQDTAVHMNEDHSYLKDLEKPQTLYHDGIGDLDGGSSWYTFKSGRNLSFQNETTDRWVNAYINNSLASAYGTYFIRDLNDSNQDWWNSYANIHLLFGNKEFMNNYSRSENCPGLSYYLETEPKLPESDGFFSWNDKGNNFTPEATRYLLVENKNPYKEDDDLVDKKDITIKKDTKYYRWIQEGDTWYAGNGSIVSSGVVGVDPYEGVLDAGLAIYNNADEQDRKAKNIYMFLALIDDRVPEVIGEYIDDSDLKTTGKLKIYIRFSEPVMSARTNEDLPITINNGTATYYATYLDGNYSDTLVYEFDTTNVRANIKDVSYQFPTDNIGDLAHNIDEYGVITNNRLPRDFTDKSRTLNFLNGEVNLLTPKLTVDLTSSSKSQNIYNILVSINDNGERNIADGVLYYTWDKNPELFDPTDGHIYSSTELTNKDLYKNVHKFSAEENGSITLTLVKNEKDNIDSGTYYLHALAMSGYGLTSIGTYGPYPLDGDPPSASQLMPSPNELKTKEYCVELYKKSTGNAELMNITINYKYVDKDGNVKEAKVKLYENGVVVGSLSQLQRQEELEDRFKYYYKSTIDTSLGIATDSTISQILQENNTSRMNFDVTFYIEDSAGNKTTSNMIKVVYDTRKLFEVGVDVPLAVDGENPEPGYREINDIAVSYKAYDYSTCENNRDIVITVLDKSQSGGENYRALLETPGAKFSVIVNGEREVAADGTEGAQRFRVTLKDLSSGFFEIIPKITSQDQSNPLDLVAETISFYLTNNMSDETDNKKNSETNLVLTNKVFQLQDQRYYYLDESGSTVISYPYGGVFDPTLNKVEGGSTYPSFSNINEAKKYVKFMEYQDLYLVKITANIANLLNSGTASTAYVKASGETVNAQEGQLWIRYKKSTWQSSATSYGWAYYYYGNGNVSDGININGLPTNLNNAINDIVNRITNEGKIIYLVEEETLNQKTGAPYLASTQLHVASEESSVSKTNIKFVTPAKYDGDKNIYQNNVTVNNQSCALATNMIIKADDATRLFYKYGDSNFTEITVIDGVRLQELMSNQATGLYTIREYGRKGICQYTIYFDKSVPGLSVSIGNTSSILDGSITNFSSDTFIIKQLGVQSDTLPKEVDDLAYIAIYSYPGRSLIDVLYPQDLNSDDKNYKLENKNYYIQVGDRSGNIVTYTVLLSNSELKVETYENDSKTSVVVKVLERDENEIYSYEVYLNETLVTTEFAESRTFKEPGIYRIIVRDIYGNEVVKTIEFNYKTPDITWYYQNNDSYSKYNPDKIVRLVIYDDESNSRYTNVYTSALIKYTFNTAYGDDNVKFEILDLQSGDYSYNDANQTVTINKLVNFRMRVWFESLPENDHIYNIKVDNEAPVVSAAFIATSYNLYVEKDSDGNVIKTASFDSINYGTSDNPIYNVGDEITLDTLQYVLGSSVETQFEDGAVISGGHIELGFQDPSRIKDFSIMKDGQLIEMVLDDDGKLLLNNYGKYEIIVTDMLSNVRRFSFTNTKDPITNEYVDDELIETEGQEYGHDNATINALYKGELRVLVKTNEGTKTYIFNFDGKNITSGKYVCVAEKRQDDQGVVTEIKSAQYQQDPNFIIDITSSTTKENVYYTAVSNDYYVISVQIKDKLPYFKISTIENEISYEFLYRVGNTIIPSYHYGTLSKEKPELKLMSGEDEIVIKGDSKYTYIADNLTIDPMIKSNITTIQVAYSKKTDFPQLETIYENGNFIRRFIGENDGFYKIVVRNVFNNVTEYIIAKVDSFEAIVMVKYLDGSTREFLSNENKIYSNSMIDINVYSDSVTFVVNGEEFNGSYDSGVTTLELYKQGEYNLRVVGANGVFEDFTFEINSNFEFVYKEEWITGYNEKALLMDQGYTSTLLTPQISKEDGIEYIAYQYQTNDLVVLYDNISEEKIYDELALIDSIGKDGIGDYIIYFKNKYGDVGSKTIHFSNVAALQLSRKTVAESNAFQPYSLEKALESDFYSNYILKFETNSLKYQFEIDGTQVSLDEPKTIEFSNASGNGSFGYQITYLDEYGNYLSFRAELYRAEVSIDKSQMEEININDKIYTKDDIVITFADELVGSVSVDGKERIDYTSGSKFYKDGKYEFYVEDIAGNRNTYIINHKSINHFTLTNTSTNQAVINGGVVNNASVAFNATDDSKLSSVFKNGEKVNDFTSNTFKTTGHWEALIVDSVGNTSYVEFYIINNPLISFEYSAPYDYSITEIFFTDSDGRREQIDAEDNHIVLNKNGDYAVVVSSNSTNMTFNFSVTINDTPPQATLSGVENGGVTSRDVTLKGLKNGDVVEVYKDGNLINVTDVGTTNNVPEIKTGGTYKIIIKGVSGAKVEYNFTRKQIANAPTSIFIIVACAAAIAGITIGLLYHTRLKNDAE